MSEEEFEARIRAITRKYELTHSDQVRVKRLRRRIQNRNYAQESRLRKKDDFKRLERRVKELSFQLCRLEEEKQMLISENMTLRTQLSHGYQPLALPYQSKPEPLLVEVKSEPSFDFSFSNEYYSSSSDSLCNEMLIECF